MTQTPTTPVTPDLITANFGSICTIKGNTNAGREWLDDKVAITTETQYWGGGIVVEPRYLDDIIDGAINDGLEVV